MSDIQEPPSQEILERYFPELLAFFFPAAHQEIDWSRGYESLDREPQQAAGEAETGARLTKVWLHDGTELSVVTQVESQDRHDAELPLKMSIYLPRETGVPGDDPGPSSSPSGEEPVFSRRGIASYPGKPNGGPHGRRAR